MRLHRLILLTLTCLLTPLFVAAQDPKQQLNEQMWEAARKGDATEVAALLDKGADVNAKFRYGTTALFKASERGHTDVVKLLLARGADTKVKDTFYGATAMTWALDNDHAEVVKALLEKDADSAGDVLMSGTRNNKVAFVEIALARGGLKAETLTSALAAAMIDKEKVAIVEMLKKAGAVPPFEVDAATLASYAGKYKQETGAEITMDSREGKLYATPAGQRPIILIAVDKTTFKPAAFDGLIVTFSLEANKVTGFTLKQGTNNTVFKKQE